jgi:site-specific recombinase XerD
MDVKQNSFGHATYAWPLTAALRVCVRAGLAGEGLDSVRIHDLRHSYASFAVNSGISLYVVAKALGHQDARTTERYAHLGADPVRQAAEIVAGKFGKAAQGSDLH